MKGRVSGPPNKLDLVGLRNLDLKHTSQGGSDAEGPTNKTLTKAV